MYIYIGSKRSVLFYKFKSFFCLCIKMISVRRLLKKLSLSRIFILSQLNSYDNSCQSIQLLNIPFYMIPMFTNSYF